MIKEQAKNIEYDYYVIHMGDVGLYVILKGLRYFHSSKEEEKKGEGLPVDWAP